MWAKRLLISAALWLIASAAFAQNPTCPTRPAGDNSNACASTAFTQTAASAAVANVLDVFLVIGDSNAVGQGVAASSVTVEVDTVKQYCAAGTISDANDPTCSAVDAARNANTGSIWPTFGLTYYRATGKKVGFILTGKSGSTQTAAADTGSGNWDSAGALFTEANTALTAGLAAYTAANYRPTLRGIIMHLGANDALGINAASITQADYITAVTAMLARWRTTLSNPSLPIYMIQTGSNITGGVSDTGYSQIRSAQKTVTNADPYTPLIFLNTLDFVIRGMMSSGAHPDQAGYNETGRETASNIVSIVAQQSFQRSGYALYWPHGDVGIGNPLPTALLSVNANRQANAETVPGGEAVVDFTNVSGTQSAIAVRSYGVGPSSYRSYVAGGTITAPAVTPNATVISALLGYGHNGTTFNTDSDAAIACASNQLFTATAHGTFCSVQVTPNGTSTKVTSQGWENDGGVTIPRTVTGGSQGLGTINATQIYRAGTVLATVATSASAADLSTGTLPAGRMPALTGDVTTSAGAVATTIANNAVSNAKLADMPAYTMKGNNSGGSSDPLDLTIAQTNQHLQAGMLKVCRTGLDLTTSNNDHSFTIPIPSTNYRVILVLVYSANASLATATASLRTATGGGGLAVAADQALSAITTTTVNTAGNATSMTLAGVYWLNSTTLQWRVGTGQAATASVCIFIDPLD